MPQTDEALKFAQRAQGALLVALNKMDVKGADADKVKTQMQERSIPSEDWGGDVVTVPISALKGENVEELLDMILLQVELMELKANPAAVAEGVIVEARMEVGRGPTATVIVQKGTLKIGDSLNLEADMIARYVAKLLAGKESPQASGLTVEYLKDKGFA